MALATAAAAAPADECLVAWRVEGAAAGSGDAALRCRDGDPACDADGAADGVCTLRAGLCLNTGACPAGPVDGVEVSGAGADAVTTAVKALAYPVASVDTCTPMAAVAVRRRAVLRARAEGAAGRADRDRLRLACTRRGGGRALVATTNFETGLLAAVGVVPPRRVREIDTSIHADAVVRVAGGYTVVLNRFLADNVQVVDPRRGFRTRLQCPTGAGSNPHDIAVVTPDKAYVTRYGATALWIVDPSARGCDGFRRGTIDLSAFADADGLPEMDQMALAGGRLFVSVQRLDRGRGFVPTGPSRLAVIDTTTDTVVGDVVLHGANAFGDASGIAHEPGTDRLVLSTPGDIYAVGDGGLERVDPDALASEGTFFVTEDALGGNVTDFALVSATSAFAIVQRANLRNALMAFDPSGAAPPRVILERDGFFPDLAVAPDGRVWLADQSLPTPGIRIFDPVTGEAVTRAAIGVGLPPFSMGFIP